MPRLPITLLSIATLWLSPSIYAEESITARLESHISFLAGDTLEGRLAGSQGNHAAGNYIVSKLVEYGVKPVDGQTDFYQLFGEGYRNIIGLIPGTAPNNKTTVQYGAHYDHVGYGTKKTSLGEIGLIHNGADDNASGTSAILELCRHFQKHPPSNNVLVVLWDAEELGLLGSKHFVNAPVFPLDNISLAVNVDMIGQLTDGTLEVHGSRSGIGLRSVIANANLDHRIPMEYKDKVVRNSDHYAFLEHEIPALMFHTGLHERYHRPADDPDTLDYKGATRIVQFLIDFATALDNHNAPFKFRNDCLQDHRAAIRLHDTGITDLLDTNGITASYVPGKPSHLRVTNVKNSASRPRNWPTTGAKISTICNIPIDDIHGLGGAFQSLLDSPSLTFIPKRSAMRKTIKLQPMKSVQVAGAHLISDLGDPRVFYVQQVIIDSSSARMGISQGDTLIPRHTRNTDVLDWLTRPKPRNAVFVERNGSILLFK